MTDKVVVLVMGSDSEECRKIARALIEKKLAACVNVTNPVLSIYRWEGKIVDEQECMMIIKTSRCLFEELQSEICRLHSYTTPEIVCLPIVEGLANYLHWLGENLKSEKVSH